MYRIPLAILLAIAAALAVQEATITSPVSRASVAKVKIQSFACDDAPSCVLAVKYQDSSNNPIAAGDIAILGFVTSVNVPSAAAHPCTSATTVAGLATAMNNTRASETGAAARIQAFRILGYFLDQGCFSQAVTLVP